MLDFSPENPDEGDSTPSPDNEIDNTLDHIVDIEKERTVFIDKFMTDEAAGMKSEKAKTVLEYYMASFYNIEVGIIDEVPQTSEQFVELFRKIQYSIDEVKEFEMPASIQIKLLALRDSIGMIIRDIPTDIDENSIKAYRVRGPGYWKQFFAILTDIYKANLLDHDVDYYGNLPAKFNKKVVIEILDNRENPE
jgi:hypothetical protein